MVIVSHKLSDAFCSMAEQQKLEGESVEPSWSAVDVLSDQLQLEQWAVKNAVQLLDKDNTIPFIARYRREQTNNMEADTLRELQDKYQELK